MKKTTKFFGACDHVYYILLYPLCTSNTGLYLPRKYHNDPCFNFRNSKINIMISLVWKHHNYPCFNIRNSVNNNEISLARKFHNFCVPYQQTSSKPEISDKPNVAYS